MFSTKIFALLDTQFISPAVTQNWGIDPVDFFYYFFLIIDMHLY